MSLKTILAMILCNLLISCAIIPISDDVKEICITKQNGEEECIEISS